MHNIKEYDENKKYKIKDATIEKYINLSNKNKKTFIYTKGLIRKKIIGYCMVVTPNKKEFTNIIYGVKIKDKEKIISDLYVEKKYRRNKIGSQLINHILNTYKEDKFCLKIEDTKEANFFWKTINNKRIIKYT